MSLPDITQLSWHTAPYPHRAPDAPEPARKQCSDCGCLCAADELRYGPGLDLHKYCPDCYDERFKEEQNGF